MNVCAYMPQLGDLVRVKCQEQFQVPIYSHAPVAILGRARMCYAPFDCPGIVVECYEREYKCRVMFSHVIGWVHNDFLRHDE